MKLYFRDFINSGKGIKSQIEAGVVRGSIERGVNYGQIEVLTMAKHETLLVGDQIWQGKEENRIAFTIFR